MLRAFFNGLVGACTVTALQKGLQTAAPETVELEPAGVATMQKLFDSFGVQIDERQLFRNALIGSILTNAMYFSQVGERRGALTLMHGVTLGCAAGIASVVRPAAGDIYANRPVQADKNAMITIAIFSFAGLAAALAAQLGGKR